MEKSAKYFPDACKGIVPSTSWSGDNSAFGYWETLFGLQPGEPSQVSHDFEEYHLDFLAVVDMTEIAVG